MPRAMTLATALPADSMVGKLATMQRASSGFGTSLTRDFRGDREHAFAADHHGQQIEARRIERLRAEFDRLRPRR